MLPGDYHPLTRYSRLQVKRVGIWSVRLTDSIAECRHDTGPMSRAPEDHHGCCATTASICVAARRVDSAASADSALYEFVLSNVLFTLLVEPAA
jgi:hypothetical protein